MSAIVSKSHKCPYRLQEHQNLAFVVYQTGSWCYSCNKGDIKNGSYYSYRDFELKIQRDLLVPTNYSSIKEFPLELKAWLYKYYVFDDLIMKHSIRYCPYSYYQTARGQIYDGEALLFPIIVNNEIVGFQQRFFPNKQFYSKNTEKYIVECGNHDTNTIVLVEDYISMIRVGETENALWVGGTNLTKDQMTYIIKNYLNIYVWLDGDQPGQENAQRIMKRLQKGIEKETNWLAFAFKEPRVIRNIVTELDPKEFSNSEIRGVLK
jgi:hypothetical protein